MNIYILNLCLLIVFLKNITNISAGNNIKLLSIFTDYLKKIYFLDNVNYNQTRLIYENLEYNAFLNEKKTNYCEKLLQKLLTIKEILNTELEEYKKMGTGLYVCLH